MPARHYKVEYTEDDANYTLLAADEVPGPGKTQTVTGLAAGTHTGKLRLSPLSGESPVASLPFTFQVGVIPMSEPVQATATASVTIADVMVVRDNLLAAIGVTATVDDAQTGIILDNVSASATVQASQSDTVTMPESLTTSASAVATIADVRAMLESVLAAATAQATVADSYTAAAGAATITDNFDTAIPTTYASFANMTETATVQGWTIASSGWDASAAAGYEYFYGARIQTMTGGFSGDMLKAFGAHTEDAEGGILHNSGFKLSKTWTAAFSAGTFSLKYRAASTVPKATIKVNGASVGALTYDGTWRTASIALGAVASILLEIEHAPASNSSFASVLDIDNIAFS